MVNTVPEIETATIHAAAAAHPMIPSDAHQMAKIVTHVEAKTTFLDQRRVQQPKKQMRSCTAKPE